MLSQLVYFRIWTVSEARLHVILPEIGALRETTSLDLPLDLDRLLTTERLRMVEAARATFDGLCR